MIAITDERIQKYLTPYRCPYPILEGSGKEGAFDSLAVDIPFVFWHNNQFYMLYTGFDGNGYQSALAVSDDLLSWKHKGVILKRNMEGNRWDRIGGSVTWIIKESEDFQKLPKLRKINGRYWLVYHSYPQVGYENGPAEIGMAWCDDEELLNWHFLEKPVFSWRDGKEWEKGGLYKACIIQWKDIWYMFYNAKDTQEHWIEQTGMAYSKDLQTWIRCEKNPLLKVNKGSWDSRFVSDPYIVRDGNTWVNFYFGYGKQYEDGLTHAQEGLAFSPDLLHWEKVGEPILTFGEPGNIDSGHAHKASIIYHNEVLYHFYCGTRPYKDGDATNANGEYRTICLAASEPVWENEKRSR